MMADEDTCTPSTYTSSSHHAMAMRRDTDTGHMADAPITETPVDLDAAHAQEGATMTTRITNEESITAFARLTHSRAMEAKRMVFSAQDALSLAYSHAAEIQDPKDNRDAMAKLNRLDKCLRKARADLEALDRQYGMNDWRVAQDRLPPGTTPTDHR